MPLVTYPFEADCEYCGHRLLFDVDTDGTFGKNGDWRDSSDDYGCDSSPLNTEEATGGHKPINIVWLEEE